MASVLPMPAEGDASAQSPLAALPPSIRAADVPALVDRLLDAAAAANASDLHLLPSTSGLAVSWRLDGVLQPLGLIPLAVASNVVARLKVLAELLTYRTDVPQEGRVRRSAAGPDLRVCTFPTLHGERVVVRVFQGPAARERIDQLGLPDDVAGGLRNALLETSGAVIVTGPAGSGKTTTLYACLREIAERTGGGRSLATLEDPIEVPLPGVAQSQVDAAAGFDLAAGLRYLVRQDPEVIGIGEIRDRATAEVALQAALTGHLVLCTFHAGSAAGAVSRLADMGLEPYALRSGILAIVSQRLLRQLCECAAMSERLDDRLGLPIERARVAVGCPSCRGSGYRGRFPVAELLAPQDDAVGRALLARDDRSSIERLARQAGLVPLFARAVAAAAEGRTTPVEVRRVFGMQAPARSEP